MNNFTLIIPSYNDYQYLPHIIKVAQKHPLIKQIILVDDASNQISKEVFKNIPDITLLTHKSNKGKAQALKTGLSKASNQNIIFLDSDLIGLSQKHLSLLINSYQENNRKPQIGIFDDSLVFRLIGWTAFFSGQRIYPKEFLDGNLQIFNNKGNISGYLIETKSNQILFDSKTDFNLVRLKGLTQKQKISKVGLKGLISDLKVTNLVIRQIGLKNFLQSLSRLKTISAS